MELASVLVIVILVAGFYVWRRSESAYRANRIRNIQEMVERLRFETPDSLTLKPDTEYCNAWCENGKDVYELILFDQSGIRDEKTTIPAVELDTWMQINGWRQTASRYSTAPLGVTLQFERDKSGHFAHSKPANFAYNKR